MKIYSYFFSYLAILSFCFVSLQAQEEIDWVEIASRDLNEKTSWELDKAWNLEAFFGSIIVINLPSSSTRLEEVRKSLESVGVKEFEVFSAINGQTDVAEELWIKMDMNWNNLDLSTKEGRETFEKQRKGETGCYLSHLAVLEIMQKRYEEAKKELEIAREQQDEEAINLALKKLLKASSVLIIEDDNDFGQVYLWGSQASKKGTGSLLRKAMLALPNDWHTLHLMAWSLQPAHPYSDHLVQLTHGIMTNAYAVRHIGYPLLIAHLRKIYDPDVHHVDPYDGAIAELQKTYPCYAISPSIAYQRRNVSSITYATSNYLRQTQP